MEGEKKVKKIIKAAFQNLQRLIWPAREESFHQLRALVDGNRLAEAGLWGWEARSERLFPH